MPLDHSHTDYLERLVSRLRELVDAHDDAARRLVDKQHTVLAVALLDLFRIQEFLEAHYVDRKGGLEPRDPIGRGAV